MFTERKWELYNFLFEITANYNFSKQLILKYYFKSFNCALTSFYLDDEVVINLIRNNISLIKAQWNNRRYTECNIGRDESRGEFIHQIKKVFYWVGIFRYKFLEMKLFDLFEIDTSHAMILGTKYWYRKEFWRGCLNCISEKVNRFP